MDSGASQRMNRRLSARVACRLQVGYLSGSSTVWHPATGMDLSNAGCRLRLGEDLSRGSDIRVRIESSEAGDGNLAAELAGHVIWSRLEGLSYQVGIQFTSDDPNLHEMLRWLLEKHPTAAVLESRNDSPERE